MMLAIKILSSAWKIWAQQLIHFICQGNVIKGDLDVKLIFVDVWGLGPSRKSK